MRDDISARVTYLIKGRIIDEPLGEASIACYMAWTNFP